MKTLQIIAGIIFILIAFIGLAIYFPFLWLVYAGYIGLVIISI